MADREILAWEVGRWMCEMDSDQPQVVTNSDSSLVLPVCRQPCLLIGDFNCEPGSPEMRSKRKFTIQAMRNPPEAWRDDRPDPPYQQHSHALVYDLSWRRLAASHAEPVLPGTFVGRKGLHLPSMLDRMLVTPELWNGTAFRIVSDKQEQAQRIIEPLNECSDHCAIGLTLRADF